MPSLKHRPRPTHIKGAGGLPALRQPRSDAPRYPEKEAGDRAAVALRFLQTRLHAGAGRASEQNLPAPHDPVRTYPLTKLLGQPLVIENRPGAASIVGTLEVARSPADG
jgi:hypothetical protein